MGAHLTALPPGMDAAIAAAIARWCRRRLDWGRTDCALSIADVYCAVLGFDPAARWRGRYRSQSGAARALGRGGLLRATARVAAECGWHRMLHPSSARTGDLAVLRVPHGATLAIRYGGLWVAPRDRGYVAFADEAVVVAWAVPQPEEA